MDYFFELILYLFLLFFTLRYMIRKLINDFKIISFEIKTKNEVIGKEIDEITAEVMEYIEFFESLPNKKNAIYLVMENDYFKFHFKDYDFGRCYKSYLENCRIIPQHAKSKSQMWEDLEWNRNNYKENLQEWMGTIDNLQKFENYRGDIELCENEESLLSIYFRLVPRVSSPVSMREISKRVSVLYQKKYNKSFRSIQKIPSNVSPTMIRFYL